MGRNGDEWDVGCLSTDFSQSLVMSLDLVVYGTTLYFTQKSLDQVVID